MEGGVKRKGGGGWFQWKEGCREKGEGLSGGEGNISG